MTPPEERIAALLDRWLESLELHQEYARLDDAAYWQARDWVPHERPTAWVIELARDKTLELKRLDAGRAGLDGEQVATAIELAVLLANLVGSQNLDRFVPLIGPAATQSTGDVEPVPDASSDTQRMRTAATPAANRQADGSDTQRQPALKASEGIPREPPPETPRPTQATGGAPRAATQDKAGRQHHAHARTAGRVATRKDGLRKDTPAAASRPASRSEKMVVADAVRLLKWGRAWHELAEAIARMSGRPSLADVRAILRDRRADIETQAASADPG